MKHLFFSLFFLVTCKSVSFAQVNQHRFPNQHYCASNPNNPTCKALKEYRDGSGIIVVSHRGEWGGSMPECSLEAVENAYNNKFRFVELDVLMTKDNVPVLIHDNTTERQLKFRGSLPHGYIMNPDFVENPQSKNFQIKDLYFNYPTTSPGDRYNVVVPALKDFYYTLRNGQVSYDRLNRFEEVLSYIKDKDMIIEVDIKDRLPSDYIRTLIQCVRLANEYNILHKLIFIMHWDKSKQMTPSYLKSKIPDTFNLMINKSSIKPAEYNYGITRPPEEKQWLNYPAVIGFDHMYKNSSDQFLKGQKSIIQDTKIRGYRTGVFFISPTDCRGSYTFGQWKDYSIPTQGEVVDKRGLLEWIMFPPTTKNVNGFSNNPTAIITDNAQQVLETLKALGVPISTATKRL